MKKKQKKVLNKKNVILFALFVFLFSLFKVGKTLASTEPFSITNAEAVADTDTVEISSFEFEDYNIQSKIIFHKVDDSVTYKITVKNNENTDYTIVSISDDNTNENISYEYDSYEGLKFNSNQEITFDVTEKYSSENTDMSSRNQLFSVNIIINLINEDGEETQEIIPIDKSNSPKTGDNLNLYITMAAVSFIVMIILIKRKDTCKNGKHIKIYSMIITGIIIIPTISKAATTTKISIKIDNEILLQDKLIFTYKIDDTVNEKIVKYNEKAEEIEIPEKDGYRFVGWKKDNGDLFDVDTAITEDTNVEAVFESNSYTISFDSKGGSAVDDRVKQYNEEIGTLPKPTKEGKILVGWYEDESYTTQISATTKVTGTKTYYAKWRDPENLEIRFNSMGGNEIPSKTIQEGAAIGELQIPEKDGYKFRGWYTDENYTTKLTADTVPTESTTYYAKWVDRMATVFSIENAVTFKGQSETIDEGEVPDQYLGTDGKYIDSHIALFSEENFDKDFEIGFTIESYDPDLQDAANKPQFVFVNTKDEDGSTNTRPGVVFRIYERNKNNFQIAAATTSSSTAQFTDYRTINTVKIYREGKKIYYRINDGEKKALNVDYSNYSGRFNTTATFGASVQRNGTVYRHLNATISNMYIKLEADDYTE